MTAGAEIIHEINGLSSLDCRRQNIHAELGIEKAGPAGVGPANYGMDIAFYSVVMTACPGSEVSIPLGAKITNMTVR